MQITGKKAEDVVRMGVALVPEGRSTVPELTVEENLRLGGMWRSKNERAGLHAQFYDLFPVLGERRKMRADTLSGGERQQLAIGRALMCGPAVPAARRALAGPGSRSSSRRSSSW